MHIPAQEHFAAHPTIESASVHLSTLSRESMDDCEFPTMGEGGRAKIRLKKVIGRMYTYYILHMHCVVLSYSVWVVCFMVLYYLYRICNAIHYTNYIFLESHGVPYMQKRCNVLFFFV